MDVILIGVAAFVGGMIASLLGWAQAEEPFIFKKFLSSLIRALVAGIVIAIAYDYSGAITLVSYLVAFLAGAGVDAGGKRVSGIIKAML